jgi:hypothetical protein
MKADRVPCKNKECLHGEMKHYIKGSGKCMVRGCPCEKYKN